MVRRVTILGAGIAGLATAVALGRAGVAVEVVERGARPFAGASSKNAAILRHAEGSTALVALVQESVALLDELAGGRAWLDRCGAVYLAPAARDLEGTMDALRARGVAARFLDDAARAALLPGIAHGGVALLVPDDGVIDLEAVRTILVDALAAHGGVLRLSSAATRGADGRIVVDDRPIATDVVVVATGAAVAALVPALPVTPMRRHLVPVDAGALSPALPVVWRLDDELYLRRRGDVAVASPCDETRATGPDDDEVRPEEVARVDEKLARLLGAPLPRGAPWACLRTWTRDRFPVAGRTGVDGEYVIGGLGGVGMSAGVAVGARLARVILDDAPDPLLDPRKRGLLA